MPLLIPQSYSTWGPFGCRAPQTEKPDLKAPLELLWRHMITDAAAEQPRIGSVWEGLEGHLGSAEEGAACHLHMQEAGGLLLRDLHLHVALPVLCPLRVMKP